MSGTDFYSRAAYRRLTQKSVPLVYQFYMFLHAEDFAKNQRPAVTYFIEEPSKTRRCLSSAGASRPRD